MAKKEVPNMISPEEQLRERDRIAIATTARPLIVGETMSWAAVWSGLLITVASLVILSALGVAIGLSALDRIPTSVAAGQSNWIIAAGLWSFGSLVVSLFMGGRVSTRVAPFTERVPATVQGTLVWILLVVAASLFGFARVAVVGMPGVPVQPGASASMGQLAPDLVSAMNDGNVEAVVAGLNDPGTADRIASATGSPRERVALSLSNIRAKVEANRAYPDRAIEEARTGLQRLTTSAPGPNATQVPTPREAAISGWVAFAGLVLTWLATIAGAAAGRRARVA